jgi:putative ABC transport system permease protein
MVFRKLWSNKWMFLCLVLGAILAIGMVTSIPMYTEGVLNRMLRRDMELFQQRTNQFPGRFVYELNVASYPIESRINNLNYFMQKIDERKHDVGLPIQGETHAISLTWLHGKREDAPAEDKGASAKIVSQRDVLNHVNIIAGRLPSGEVVDGVYEVMMSRGMMHSSDYLLDQVYDVADTRTKVKSDDGDIYTFDKKFKIVGIFDIDTTDSLYWYDYGDLISNNLVMDYDLTMRDFVYIDNSFLQTCTWYIAYDYQQIDINSLPAITAALDANIVWLKSYYAGPATAPALDLMLSYNNREQTLRTMLSVMQVPILIMLAFYIFMVTQLILSSEKSEIAVFKSRGASRTQIMGIYLIESLIVAGIGLICGPPLGYFICMVLGSSNGFLEFVSRRALPIEITPTTIRFALVAVVAIVVMIMTPAFFASKIGIVEQKQGKTKRKIALWKKTGIDFILLGIAAYGWYAYQMRQTTLESTGGVAVEVPVDPILFLLSTAFIMGAGLLFLRFYPLIIRCIYAIGRKGWSPSLYASFVQVGRSGGQEQFLMLFLIITLSLGIFSANSANTINLNVEEKIMYQNGADLVLTPVWRSNERPANTGAPSSEDEGFSTNPTESGTSGYANQTYITYVEPPFDSYAALDGVENAAKVFIKEDISLQQPGKASQKGMLMAIEPSEFAKVATMPGDLLKPHWYDYLNLLSMDEGAALVSRDYAEKNGLEPGDVFSAMWSEQNPVSLTAYAIIDYWPTYNPLAADNRNFIVCNLSRVRAVTAIEPYQIWYARAEGATSAQIYAQIEEKKLQMASIVDANQLLIEAKNDPMLQGTNGALTMAFIVTMTVSFFGFVIYWVLSIKGRVLQFGILRAMGMSMRSIIGMLLWEQLLISGVAVIIGVVLGGATAQVFTPLLQMVYDAAEQIPPLHVVANRADYEKIYAIIIVMLSFGFAILGVMISRIRIAQALKLGED